MFQSNQYVIYLSFFSYKITYNKIQIDKRKSYFGGFLDYDRKWKLFKNVRVTFNSNTKKWQIQNEKVLVIWGCLGCQRMVN